MMLAVALPDLIEALIVAFPRQDVKPETIRLYVEDLADLPPAVVEEALIEVRRTSRFFPSISEIRAVAAERMLGVPDEPTALRELERHVYWQPEWKPCDACDARGWTGEELEDLCETCRGSGQVLVNTRPLLHPAVSEALDLLGGHIGYREADQLSVVRGQFLNLYRQVRIRSLREVQAGLVALPAASERRALPPAHAA